MCLYRRKYGRYPTFAHKRIINEPTPAVPRRSRRLGVWRPGHPDEGLPGYTMEAKDGEMSLGVGRKRTDEEEYEMEDHVERTSGESGTQEEIGREARQPSVASVGSARGDGEPLSTRPSNGAGKPSETLPPYIPPPSPAFLADSGFGRVGSRNSVSSTRRNSFPRVQLPAPSGRRGSRVG
jgi:hypothetical protein